MLWFRHNNDMRNTPEMRSVATTLGAHGVAAAYRLLEVWCRECGSGDNFEPTLTLAGARDEVWLANEILLPDENDSRESDDTYGVSVAWANRSTKRLDEFLTCFELSGLIEQGTTVMAGWKIVDGKKVAGEKMEFKTITLTCADGLLDAWTSRYKHKGVGQGKGGGGYRS